MAYLLILCLINGTTGKVQGTVRDQATKESIVGANIEILGTELGTASDENGDFFILSVPRGRYTIEISYIGYQSKRVENAVVEIDQTVRLNITLTQTTIEMPPITVTSEIPQVKKDMVGTTYILRSTEITTLPIDYAIEMIAFQPAVTRTDTGIHVRGGRSSEVQYMIDNVSIIDPQTGDLAIAISKGVIDEVIFLPGGFDVEYGRAMSGVINVITAFPKDNIELKGFTKTERIMPYYFDFGYENYNGAVHIPINKKNKGYFSIDLMQTNDWDPKLFILPHKNRSDYSFYGKWIAAPSGKFNLMLSGAMSNSQFDRYNSEWKYNLDHYRSDHRQSDLQILSLSFLPDSRKLFNLNLNRLYTNLNYGVRVPGSYGFFNPFQFQDYETLRWPAAGSDNPFGAVHQDIVCEGDYPEYRENSSQVLKTHFSTIAQLNRYHELKAGVEYAQMDFNNFTYFVSDSQNQLIDEYNYQPSEYSVYIQDNIDFRGLYAKIGCRYDHFSSGVNNIEPKTVISPRLGISFMVTEKFIFRTNVGSYAQPPLYDKQYVYYGLYPFPSYLVSGGWLPLVGNPDLKPEKTVSYEIGFQGAINPNLTATLNSFYKDVADLIGTRLVLSAPHNYVQYRNIEYANIKGVETILEFANSLYTGKISYTLSFARGSSSYAEEVYRRYYADNPDTTFIPEAKDYPLDFDQRHKLFFQGMFKLPLQTKLYLFAFFGEGFPYTPPGPEGKYEERNYAYLPVQKQIDCVLSKSFKISRLQAAINFEIINLLDIRNEINSHFPLVPLEDIKLTDFEEQTSYVAIDRAYYSPQADLSHDGLLVPYEQYRAFYDMMKESDDWVNAYTAPRRARVGVNIVF
ncbi:hypothetical protein A2Y85_03895 [candidate division WOR-3 bacterium RBG_13_43_14]|uniref:TonB-dependent receptor-like beta-barrel domain-containing protein n=1 Tax=candidate division WOR-3 bacterium RBG_13_43_14 TaxID=1802590 RepID=A0A1F4UAY4_UNCW3|nr:MAG: hypothetical protein A2Y85_03895 [candidate division WOR-3 bacterium RBG_13_43_14]